MNAPFAVPLAELRQQLDAAKAKLAVAMAEIAPLQTAVVELQGKVAKALEDQFKQAFAAADKASGDITITIGDGKYKASIDKSVKWDSTKLQAIASTMSWQEAQGLFKIDFSVSEANYKAAQNLKPELAEKLLDARTVKYGDLKISIVE